METAAADLVRLIEEQTGRAGRRMGKNIRLLCPAHEDHNPSLDIAEAADGSPLVICRVCEAGLKQVCEALQVKVSDYLPSRNGAGSQVTTVYSYVKPDGSPHQRVSRTADKRFLQSFPDSREESGWAWKTPDGFKRVLYHADEVARAIQDGATIFICEGEKDADAVRAQGGVGTCNPMGAGKWWKELTEQLSGAGLVVVIADNDTAGLEHARRVRDEIDFVVGDVQLVRALEGKDAYDHLAAGHTLAQLVPLEDEPVVTGDRPVIHTLAQILAEPDPVVDELVEDLVEAAAPGAIIGVPEIGKGWLALELGWRVAAGEGDYLGKFPVKNGGPVLYWWEDTSEAQATKRIKKFSALNQLSPDLPYYFARVERIVFPAALENLETKIVEHGLKLVILDSLYNFAPAGFTLKDEEAATMILEAKTVCDRTGCSIIFVDHAPWPTELSQTLKRPRAYGSVFKGAALRYALYLETSKSDGEAWFTARGNNIAGCPRTLALLDKQTLRWNLHEITSESDLDLREEVLNMIESVPGIGAVKLREGVGAKAERVREIVNQLEAEKLVVVVSKGEGKPRLHYLNRDSTTLQEEYQEDLEWE